MQVTNKKDIPEVLDVEIEKLSNLGYGITKINGYVIFVEGACPGDKVKIKVGKKNKNFANAKVLEVKVTDRFGRVYVKSVERP